MYGGPKQHLYLNRSILKSTRHKNWLSVPGEKRVTFQFEIPKITGNKLRVLIPAQETTFELTMVKAANERNGLPGNKRSGISPFIYSPETFPEDHPTQSIETTENGSKIKTKMHVLEGDEAPELFMDWLSDYEDKIFTNEVLKAPAKLSMMRRLVDGEAQTILSKVEKDYRETYSLPDNVDLLTNYKIREDILTKYTADAELRTYFGDGGNAAMKVVKVEHII